ncbi:MAG: hypothetical protein LBU39_05400, partial [Desulfobulbaceae bacterium]|nr:hypothetical protein [Desulfobulbaceae bacterium]
TIIYAVYYNFLQVEAFLSGGQGGGQDSTVTLYPSGLEKSLPVEGGVVMDQQRRKHSAEFKAQVALEAARGVKTISEISSQYQIYPVMVANWKKELLNQLPTIFASRNATKKTEDHGRESACLERKIGQLTMEVEWLEKKCKQLGIPVNG